jgi:hypothetical protein
MTSRFFFMLIPIGILVWLCYEYEYMLPAAFSTYILLPVLLISVNYIFLQIILYGIEYYGKMMLITDTEVILIFTSFLLVDDIEFMDMKSILKVDVERHGILANIFDYGHLLLEQRNEIRTVHYVPYPHSLYQAIKNRIPKKDTIGPA